MSSLGSLSDFLKTYGNTTDTNLSQVYQQLGIDPSQAYTREDAGEGGSLQAVNPDIATRFAGYTVDRVGGDTPGTSSAYVVRDANGNAVSGGSQQLAKDSAFDKFMYSGAPIGLMIGAGALNGAFGGAASTAGAAGEAAGAASGGSAGFTGFGQGAGAALTPASLTPTAGGAFTGALDLAAAPTLSTGLYTPAAAASTGGLLSSLSNMGGTVGNVAQWMQKNPGLSKALFSAGTGLLASGLSSSNPVNMGIGSRVGGQLKTANNLAAPMQTTIRPVNQSSGAWRYLLG